MSLTSHENILKVLIGFNPWWKLGTIRPEFSKTYKRFAFYETMKILLHESIRRTVILTGTRRVGKTTIQYQIIDDFSTFALNKSPCALAKSGLRFHQEGCVTFLGALKQSVFQ